MLTASFALAGVGVARADDQTRGWAAFGAETGMLAASAATAGIANAAMSDNGEPMWVAAPALALGVGLPILGAWALGRLADANDWDRDAGWSAAGLWPGAMWGMMLANGALLVADPDPDGSARAAIATVGALAGAIVGALVLHHAASTREHPGWHLLAAWAGLAVGMLVGFAVQSRTSNAPEPMLLAPAFAAAGVATAHLVSW